MFSEDQYRADLARYRDEARTANARHGAEHPLTRMWLRRARTVERLLGRLDQPAPEATR